MPMNQSYGGFVWSDEAAPTTNSLASQGVTLGFAAAAGAGVFAYGVKPNAAGHRPIDSVINMARFAGNLTPYQIGNTFRVPEWLMPFASPEQQGLKKVGSVWQHEWGIDELRSKETRAYLQKMTGFTESQLAQVGILPDMAGSADQVASKLVFERTVESSSGSLYSIVDGKRKKIADGIQLMTLSSENANMLTSDQKLNKAAHGILQAVDAWSLPGFKDPDRLFRAIDSEGKAGKKSLFMPFNGINGPMGSLSDAWKRTTYARAIPAFEMQRFNDLIGGFTEQFLGKKGAKALTRMIGITPDVLPGPASSMFLRFGGRAMLAGAGIMGIKQVDWIRRNYGFGGEVIASGAISAGTAYLANKLTKSPKTAMMAGVASFFGQMVLPGFDQGIWPGIATTYSNAMWMKASSLNPMNYYRRAWEGLAPGISDWKTGALVGIGAVMASVARSPFSGKNLGELLVSTLGPDRLNLPDYLKSGEFRPVSTRRRFWDRVREEHVRRFGNKGQRNVLPWERASLASELRTHKDFQGPGGLTKEMNAWWSTAEDLTRQEAGRDDITKAFRQRIKDIGVKYAGSDDIFSGIAREAEGLAAQFKYGLLGAQTAEAKVAKTARRGGFKTVGKLGGVASVALGAFGMHQLLFGGLLGSMETSAELRAQYEGRELVEVKKSRWWEGGGTPFEGGDTSYFRPHAYHLLMNRTREAGIWGEGEDEISPIGKFLRKNFTYELEKKNYWDRPYPITSAAFADVPIIGGLLSSTIGNLIKPARLMHTGEWMRSGPNGVETAHVYQGARREPAYSLGAEGPGKPVSPYSLGQQAVALSYQFRELEGLTGWAKNVLQDSLTGSQLFTTDPPVLADSGLMTSPRVMFWEAQLGGLGFTNEALRRILPRYRSEVDRVNPIVNSMPAWLPEKFHYGDPYRNVEWGESRLPGAGYATLHPELQGLDPEDYPLIYQYSILADVAPFSSEFLRTRERIYQMRSQGGTSERENAYMDRVDQMVRERYDHKEFDKRIHPNAILLPGSSATQAIWFGGKQALRDIAAPIEYLVPGGIRPTQKLLGDRDMISQYEYERMYGTPYAFWDKPWRDWFRPAAYSAAHLVGMTGKPMWRTDADANAEYFDRLEFAKWMDLAEEAEANGDGRTARMFRQKAGQTRTGVNPMGNPLGIYWSLPESDRQFFNAFAHAGPAERERVLQMIPSDQVHLYKAIWARMDSGDPGLWAGSPTQMDDAYMAAQYGDTQAYLQGTAMPPDDWIGWHEDVDISDIRVRYIDELGRDLHDYGLWESELKKSLQQPFLEGSTQYLHGASIGYNSPRSVIAAEMHQSMRTAYQAPYLAVHSFGSQNHAQFTYDDSRTLDTLAGLGAMFNVY